MFATGLVASFACSCKKMCGMRKQAEISRTECFNLGVRDDYLLSEHDIQ